MQISVVIATYQRQALLRKCLKALQQQLLNKDCFEVIVVSDGPDEISADVVVEFEDGNRFRYLSLAEKRGPAAARNFGWLNARAPLIAFTDDDTLPNENWLNHLLGRADVSKPQAFTGRVIVPRFERPTDYELNTAGLETADFVTANCACTKAALIACGGFDERFSMAWREDSDLEFKLLQQNIPITKVDNAIVVHPVRAAKWGTSIDEQKKTLFNALLYKKFPKIYRERIQPKPPYLYYGILIALVTFLTGWVIGMPRTEIFGGIIWLLLTTFLVVKRLKQTSLKPAHILEMVYTSMLIPHLSLYWQWYGAIKYRTILP
ncbi:glycosyltransferase family 2 protein [Mucilaginibacter ginkgonis]|nr:glycosyltransferase [Mucilaginibacter ginkgonis]